MQHYIRISYIFELSRDKYLSYRDLHSNLKQLFPEQKLSLTVRCLRNQHDNTLTWNKRKHYFRNVLKVMNILPLSYNFSPLYSCDPVQISLDRTRYLRVREVSYVAYKSFDKSSKRDTKIWLLILPHILGSWSQCLSPNRSTSSPSKTRLRPLSISQYVVALTFH
jgi:hypothetical protein